MNVNQAKEYFLTTFSVQNWKWILKTTDSSDEGDISSATLNSSVEQFDLLQRASITSLEDLSLASHSKTTKDKSTAEEIEDIIRRRGEDTSDPRHSKPTDCDLIALQKVIVFFDTWNIKYVP